MLVDRGICKKAKITCLANAGSKTFASLGHVDSIHCLECEQHRVAVSVLIIGGFVSGFSRELNCLPFPLAKQVIWSSCSVKKHRKGAVCGCIPQRHVVRSMLMYNI